MEQEYRHAIALMRYSAIAPLIPGLPEGYRNLADYLEKTSQKGLLHPNGEVRNYAPKTLYKWYFTYQKGGFDALLPAGRNDCGRSRKLDDDLKEKISYLKGRYPRMGAAAIFRQLKEDGSIKGGEVSESTVNRYVNRLALEAGSTPVQDMRRYERPHVNEVWCGDSSVGPYLRTADGRKRRVYVIALIDDASRLVTGAGVFFEDTFVNLMSVMKSAVAKYGVPRMFNFDNGSAYKNKQMELLAARIGTTINYCKPYTPTAKAKVERWFRTMKDQWMASLDMRDFPSLEALSGSLCAYVRGYNLSAHSSLKGSSPQERFFSEPEKVRRLPEEKMKTDFLLELERRVSADSVVTIGNVEYEVDMRFARQRIRLRCSPGMDEVYVAEADGTLLPVRLLNKQENASVKREKLLLSEGGEG
ncbi:DDE-type integrase/transposase/recombinase [Candidatus Merdisoma sp. JLR.KK006]|uniref:DDE-type integrase/transposase/recombinase n=1 Tax=Candidatus Merdisoma sp. JLR.KK006 TaxID=3112626 RepID=UPI002FEF5DF9